MGNNGFKPGSPGRPKGAINKRTREAREIAEAAGFCPITSLMQIHKIAMTRFVEEIDKEDFGRISPMESNAAKYLKIAADNASDLTGYLYPKLKSVEQIKADPTKDMTPMQRLMAMKQAVALFEANIQGEPVEKDEDGRDVT